MRKGLKKLVIFGGVILAGVIVYRKVKKSEEGDFAKEFADTVREKVDETMKEADVKEFLDRKAKKIVNDISFGKSLERMADKVVDGLIRKVKRTLFKKIAGYAFWSEWLE